MRFNLQVTDFVGFYLFGEGACSVGLHLSYGSWVEKIARERPYCKEIHILILET